MAHSSALCHPADTCCICMAAGDPRIKRLQECCHISFNNIIILRGRRCFIPDALQSSPPPPHTHTRYHHHHSMLICLPCLHLSSRLSSFFFSLSSLSLFVWSFPLTCESEVILQKQERGAHTKAGLDDFPRQAALSFSVFVCFFFFCFFSQKKGI